MINSFKVGLLALICAISVISNAVPPPPNDNFADATVLTGVSGTIRGSNVGAIKEGREPAQDDAINSIWYKWQAPTTGLYVFDTCGSNFSTYLSVFTGTAVNALTTIVQDNESCESQSAVAFSANAEEIFHMAVDGQGSATGAVVLNYQLGNTKLLVKDIYPGSNDSIPSDLTNINGTLFFTARDGTFGGELWKSDGTEAGTVLVKDIIPGSASTFPFNLTSVNGTLFFGGEDDTNGAELWTSDGTESGTVLVKNIYPVSDSNPDQLTNVNGTLFFSAIDGTNGDELWMSDGTEAGTVLVKNINPDSSSSFPEDLTNVNGTLFFTARDGTTGVELWSSDGTESGTVLVEDIRPGSNWSDPTDLTNVSGTLFFSASDGIHGAELWASDGTENGAVLFKDIRPGSSSSNSSPLNLSNVNGTLFFSANDGVNGRELWASDGTEEGTVLVKDISPVSGSSVPSRLTNVNGTLFFTADDGINGDELWTSDGTEAGTMLVKDISPGSDSSDLSLLTNVNGTLFFSVDDGINGVELWTSDGTEMGTVLVEDIFSGLLDSSPTRLTNVNGTLFFRANGGFGSELYATADVISNFADVQPGSFGFQFIEVFFGAQITGGCTPGNYCPNDPVTRAQMAVFLEKAARGANFSPPPATGVFTDVPVSNPFAAWIEQLAADGITGGCGTNIYCPDQTVTRGQMAVFIEKALRGSNFNPPAAIGQFADVPISDPFAPWIEQLANDNITGGCGGGNYCPANPVTRAQMAIFMVKAFNLGFVPN